MKGLREDILVSDSKAPFFNSLYLFNDFAGFIRCLKHFGYVKIFMIVCIDEIEEIKEEK